MADEWIMSIECQWEDNNGRSEYLEKNLFHGHFVYHRFHKDWSGLNLGLHGERLITGIQVVGILV
jgi:hypothetical protein